MVEKPERFFDTRGRQEYLTEREAQLREHLGPRAPVREVVGVFMRLLLVELASILGLMVLIAVFARMEDGDAGWQSAFLGPALLILVPLAGTAWTLIALGGHDFSAPPSPGAVRVCVALLAPAFIVFIVACVWVLGLLDPQTYDASTVAQLSWSALAIATTIVGLCLIMLLTWRFRLSVNLALGLGLAALLVFVGLLPVLQQLDVAWSEPLLMGLRVAGPLILIIGLWLLPTERVLLVAENDVVNEAAERGTSDFDSHGPTPRRERDERS